MRARTPSKPVNDVLTLLVKSINLEEDGKLLWNIVSALRGPDSDLPTYADKRLDQVQIKEATTCVLRYALGLNYGIHDGPTGQYWFSVNEDTAALAEYRQSIPSDHFGQHARDAFRALGLKWGEVNDFNKKKKVAKNKKKTARKRVK